MGLLDTAINMAAKQFTNKEGKTLSLPQSEADIIERRKRAESMLHNKSLMFGTW